MEASTPVEPTPEPATVPETQAERAAREDKEIKEASAAIRKEARAVVNQYTALVALAAEIDYADTDRFAQLWDDYKNPKAE